MNSGVLLMRNTDWMRDLFNQMARYGTHPMDYAMEEVRAWPCCTNPCTAALMRVAQPCAHLQTGTASCACQRSLATHLCLCLCL